MLYYDYETYQMLQIRLSEYYFAMANFTLGSSHKEKIDILCNSIVLNDYIKWRSKMPGTVEL